MNMIKGKKKKRKVMINRLINSSIKLKWKESIIPIFLKGIHTAKEYGQMYTVEICEMDEIHLLMVFLLSFQINTIVSKLFL